MLKRLSKIFRFLQMSVKTILIALAYLGFCSLVGAQPFTKDGIIFGKITDATTQEVLSFSTVQIINTTIGQVTGDNGKYEIKVVPGTYIFRASFIGYESDEIEITISDGESKEVNFELLFGQGDIGDEVTITAQAIGQAAAINEQINSNKIVNIVSAEKMKELPDANVAESIGRLPGVSLQRSSGEANKIVIRGLSPKFNNVTIDGVKMASTNDFDRSADLSLIQGEMLNGVEVSKSLRADMDANAIGGTVNLKLRTAPDEMDYSLDAQGGYNDVGSSWNNYKLVGMISNRYFDNKIGAILQLTSELKQLPSHRFGGSYSSPFIVQTIDEFAETESEFKLRTFGTTLTDQLTERNRNGGNVTLDFRSDIVDIKFFSLYNHKLDQGVTRNNTFQFIRPNQPFSKQVNSFENNTNLWTSSLTNTFKLSNTELIINAFLTQARHNTPGNSYNFIELSSGANPISQDFLIFRLPSDVLETFGGTSADSTFLQSHSVNENKLSDNTFGLKLDWNIPFKLTDKFSGTFSFGGKYQNLNRTNDNFQEFVNYQYGAGRPRKEGLVELFPEIITNLSAQNGISANNWVDPSYNPGQFLDGRYELGWGANIDLLNNMHDLYYQEHPGFYQKNGYNNFFKDYKGTEEAFAGYAMAEVNLGDLMVLPGIRYEVQNTTYESYHIELLGANANGIRGQPDSVTTYRDNAFFFPSINLKYKVKDWGFVQAAVYKSTSRPDFGLLSPLVIITENTNDPFTSGNPMLKPSTAWNYDLGLAVHSNKIGLFTVNVFYKKVTNFIFTLNNYFPNRRDLIVNPPEGLLEALPGADFYPMDRLDEVHRTDVSFNNLEEALYKGLEISWQTSFWYLRKPFNGLVMDVNVSILRSETQYPYFEDIVIGIDSSGFFPQDIIGFEYLTRQGRLVNQPSALFNLILGWDYKGFSSRVSFRYQDRSYTSLDSRLALSNSYYDTFTWFDVSLKQKINNHLSVFSNLTNVGKHIDDFFMEFGDVNLPTNSEQYGFRTQFGLNYKL